MPVAAEKEREKYSCEAKPLRSAIWMIEKSVVLREYVHYDIGVIHEYPA